MIDGAVVADGRPGRRSASVWRPFVRRLGDVDFQRLNDLWCASNSSVDDFMTMGKRRRNERRKGGRRGGFRLRDNNQRQMKTHLGVESSSLSVGCDAGRCRQKETDDRRRVP